MDADECSKSEDLPRLFLMAELFRTPESVITSCVEHVGSLLGGGNDVKKEVTNAMTELAQRLKEPEARVAQLFAQVNTKLAETLPELYMHVRMASRGFGVHVSTSKQETHYLKTVESMVIHVRTGVGSGGVKTCAVCECPRRNQSRPLPGRFHGVCATGVRLETICSKCTAALEASGISLGDDFEDVLQPLEREHYVRVVERQRRLLSSVRQRVFAIAQRLGPWPVQDWSTFTTPDAKRVLGRRASCESNVSMQSRQSKQSSTPEQDTDPVNQLDLFRQLDTHLPNSPDAQGAVARTRFFAPPDGAHVKRVRYE